MLDVEPAAIEAEVYHYDPKKDRFFLKITFLGSGMYINSFSVMPSKFEEQPLWVQPPKHRQKNGWVPTVDFDKSYPLWREIESKAIEATKTYASLSKSNVHEIKDVVIEDVPEGPITEINAPF